MKKLLPIAVAIMIAGCTAAAPPSPPATGDTGSTRAAATATETPATPAASPSPTNTTRPDQAATPVETAGAELDHGQLMQQLLFGGDSQFEGREILPVITESGDTRFVAALIDTLRYHRGLQPEIGQALNSLTGQNLPPDWFAWVEWAGQHPEIESFAGYPAWKGTLFAAIDPNFRRFVYDGMPVAPDSRVEEIVWGGVRVDGIPALDNPTMIDPAKATYLVPEERVFGLSLNGDTRAYPARFLDWHEMFNDIVGGEPVSLAY